MKRCLLASLVLITVGWTASPCQAQKGKGKAKGGDASRYGWLSSLAEGKAQARKTGKPLLVVIRCVP
jgi:hypothetical protein